MLQHDLDNQGYCGTQIPYQQPVYTRQKQYNEDEP